MSASIALALLAAAVLLGGHRVGAGRLRAATVPRPVPDPAPEAPLRTAWLGVGATSCGALGWVLGGPVAAVLVAGAVLATGIVVRRSLAGPADPPADPADLAACWELLAVCLRSGLPVAAAVEAAAAPLRGSPGPALRRVAGLLQLGADAVDAWRVAADEEALATFARAAGRSAATGAALAQVAATEASRLRGELVHVAQARAQRAGVLITGPLGLCFLPAFLILGIAPVVIGLAGEAVARW